MTKKEMTKEDRVIKLLKKVVKELRLIKGAITFCNHEPHSWELPRWHVGAVRYRRRGYYIDFMVIDIKMAHKFTSEYSGGSVFTNHGIQAAVDFDRCLVETMMVFRQKTGHTPSYVSWLDNEDQQ